MHFLLELFLISWGKRNGRGGGSYFPFPWISVHISKSCCQLGVREVVLKFLQKADPALDAKYFGGCVLK